MLTHDLTSFDTTAGDINDGGNPLLIIDAYNPAELTKIHHNAPPAEKRSPPDRAL